MRETIAPSKDRKGTNDTGKRTLQFKQGRKETGKTPDKEQINKDGSRKDNERSRRSARRTKMSSAN